ncbi:cache domain-containing protein [Bacillus sp. N9]
MLPAVSTFTVYNYLTKDAVKEQAIISANNDLKLKEQYLNKIFEDMLYTLNYIQMDTELSSSFKNKNATKDLYDQFIDEKRIQKLLNTVTLLGQNAYVSIVLKDGMSYTNYSRNEYNPEKLLNEQWIKDLSEVKGYQSTWFAPQTTMLASEKNRSPFQISVARALRDGHDIYGYAMVTIPGYKITDILKGSDEDHGIILQNEVHTMITSYGSTGLAEQMNEAIINDSSNVIKLNGENYLVSRYKVSINDWTLISFIRYNKAVYSIDSIFKKVFVVQTAAFILFFLLLAYLLNRILNPLVYLKRVAKKCKRRFNNEININRNR